MFFGGSRQLFGILTSPECGVAETGVLFFNAGLLHNVGPFRLYIDLAVRLGEAGIPTLRIDQSGKGESMPRTGLSRVETVREDFQDCLAELQKIGVNRVVLIGLCSGADDAFEVLHEPYRPTGIIMLDGFARKTARFFVNRYGPKVLSYKAWLRLIGRVAAKNSGGDQSSWVDEEINIRDWSSNAEMIKRIDDFLLDGGHMLAVYTHGQSYYNYEGQLREVLSARIPPAALEEIYFEDADHTYTSERQREELVSSVVRWVRNTYSHG
jgi:hypothetical protein